MVFPRPLCANIREQLVDLAKIRVFPTISVCGPAFSNVLYGFCLLFGLEHACVTVVCVRSYGCRNGNIHTMRVAHTRHKQTFTLTRNDVLLFYGAISICCYEPIWMYSMNTYVIRLHSSEAVSSTWATRARFSVSKCSLILKQIRRRLS